MLTKKEKETYDFIIDFQRKYGQFPLLTEIADGIGITSKGVVHRYVKSLVDQDKIQKIRYKHRGYMLKKIGSDISFSIKKLGKIVVHVSECGEGAALLSSFLFFNLLN